MRKFLFVTTLLSFGLGVNFSHSAQSASSSVSEPLTKKDGPSNAPGAFNEKEDQTQMAAGMKESLQAAQDFVNDLDKGQYGQSWGKGDALFQQTFTKEEWIKVLNETRKGLGKMKSRQLKDQRPAWDPNGLPKGAYMVVEYETSFENSPSSLELLTLRKGAGGKWRVLTYEVN